jgi:hypothetical protein
MKVPCNPFYENDLWMKFSLSLAFLVFPTFCGASSLMEENWERHLGVQHPPLMWSAPDPDLRWHFEPAPRSSSFVPRKKGDRPSDKNNDQKTTRTKNKALTPYRDDQGFIYFK